VIVYPYNNQPIRSDHFLISFEICHDPHNQSHSNPKYIYDYSKVDYTGLCHYLSTSNIYSCLQFDEVETVRTIINQTLHQAIDLFVPKVRIRTKQYHKWFNSQLIHEANCLRTLSKKYSCSPTDHNLNHLTVAEKSFTSNLESVKVTYETNLIESLKSQLFIDIWGVSPTIKEYLQPYCLMIPIPLLTMTRQTFLTITLVLFSPKVHVLLLIHPTASILITTSIT